MKLNDETRKQLIESAIEAARWAYAPYSNYAVGAALMTDSGRIYDGVNVENAVYPLSICAERVALFKAVSEGETRVQAIAVATRNGGSPCGSCRQVLAEFQQDMLVLMVNFEGEVIQEASLRDLLPYAFGAQDLNTTE